MARRLVFAAWLSMAALAPLLLAFAFACDEDRASAEWLWLDNGEVRVGMHLPAGGAIGWVSEPGGENLIDHADAGRYVQQSFYGDPDGTDWNGQPWRWNPIQGGDWKGGGGRVLEARREGASLYVRSVGRHWAGCRDLPEATFEQWVVLDGPVVRVRYRFTYSGTASHAALHHEVPAVYVPRSLGTLLLCTGETLEPGGPGNPIRAIPDHWAAWLGAEGRGIGVLVPQAAELGYFRVSDCCYCAPIVLLAVTPGLVFEYETFLTIGDAATIRQRFERINNG